MYPEQDPMLWESADLLDCSNIERIFNEILSRGTLAAFVLDKSTADAISCGAEVCIVNTESPVYTNLSGFKARLDTKYEPLELLLLHLAYLTRAGGYYLAMSYSSTRFDVLETK